MANHATTRTTWTICCLALVLAWLISPLSVSADEGREFTTRGPGGAGGVYTPSFSSFQKGLILLGTDMGTAFRSVDDGKSWEMISRKSGLKSMQFSPPAAFFEDAVVWSAGKRTLCRSRDRGMTWTMIADTPWAKKKENILHLCALPGTPGVLLVSTEHGVWRSEDFGATFTGTLDASASEFVVLGETVYALAGNGTLVSSKDRGRTWSARPLTIRGLKQGAELLSFTGGESAAGRAFFACIKGLGIVRSLDDGASWESVRSYKGENLLRMDPGQDRVVYAVQTKSNVNNEVLRSTDGGETWENVFRLEIPWNKKFFSSSNVEPSWAQTELLWGYYITPNGLAMDPFDARHLVVTTQGDMYETRDGGETWRPIINEVLLPEKDGDSPRYVSIGLEVTSCWSYYFDPHKDDYHYAAYTDIGFVRSEDGGRSWSWAVGESPWRNTFYQLALDPDVPGRLYAATSNRHDIPYDMSLSATFPEARPHQGGVVVSKDWGRNWSVPYQPGKAGGLPKQVCTTIALDPRSPQDSRTLYVGLFGEGDTAGVYRSDDGGRTWARKSSGLGVVPNLHVYRIAIHPKSGDLFCLITGLRMKGAVYKIPGGIWKSTDKGESWRCITRDSELNWQTTALLLNPENEREIYVTAATPAGHWLTGGLYRTRDGGKTWDHILTDKQIAKAAGDVTPWDQTMSVAVHPDDPNLIYVGTSRHGLLYSRDDGKTWKGVDSFPFNTVNSITVNPKAHDRIVVTTFGGGIWEGPALPE